MRGGPREFSPLCGDVHADARPPASPDKSDWTGGNPVTALTS